MSSLWHPHPKEAPLTGLTGLWGGVGSNLVSGGEKNLDGDYVTGSLYYRWDFGIGGDYTDSQSQIQDISGNGRHGTINAHQSGLYQSDDKGAYVIGTGSQHYLSRVGGPNVNNFTLEFWIKPENSSQDGLMDTAPNQVHTVRMSQVGKVEWWSNDPTTQTNIFDSGSTWIHAVYTFNNSGSVPNAATIELIPIIYVGLIIITY